MQGACFTKKVVLLLSPVDMDGSSAGQIYLQALISTVLSIRIVSARLPGHGYLEYLPRSSALSRVLVSLASRVSGLQTLKMMLYRQWQLTRDIRRAQILLERYGAESIWMTLSSAESILLAYELIQGGVRLKGTVWDAPEHILRSQNISSKFSSVVMNKFSEVIRSAESISVISTNMQELYQQQYKTSAIVIRPIAALPAVSNQISRRRPTLRLVFAGSLYAKNEWNALMKSLAARQWRIAGKRVVIYFFGAFPLRGVVSDRRVKQLGYRPENEVAAISGKCDAGYLPYWLSGDKALVAATSFPSKLAAYIGCGLPVFNHGPSSSEVTRIMRDHAVGVSCHSLEVDEIVSSLDGLAKLTNQMSTQKAIRELVQSELSSEVVGQRFSEFLAKSRHKS